MKKYPRLKEMGILNPQQIEKFAVYTLDEEDILRVTYKRKKGSLLPVSRKYRFYRIKHSVVTDSGSRKTVIVNESAPAFREALGELETLSVENSINTDLVSQIKEELRLLDSDIALRTEYIKALVNKL